MKLKIFIRMIGWPLLFVSSILWPLVDRLSIPLLVFIVFMGFILFVAIRKRFLSKFIITENKIYVHFVTGVCVSKTVQWHLDDISQVQLIKSRPAYGKTAMLHVKAGRNSFDFSIIDARLFDEVAHIIASTYKQPNKQLSPMASRQHNLQ